MVVHPIWMSAFRSNMDQSITEWSDVYFGIILILRLGAAIGFLFLLIICLFVCCFVCWFFPLCPKLLSSFAYSFFHFACNYIMLIIFVLYLHDDEKSTRTHPNTRSHTQREINRTWTVKNTPKPKTFTIHHLVVVQFFLSLSLKWTDNNDEYKWNEWE